MTKPGKKTNQTKGPRDPVGVMAKAEKKPRQTGHRLAASKREVQERIKRLRKRWGRAKGEERRERVADLLERGCSVRGLAEEIHKRESVVRYYSKPVPDSVKREKPKALLATVPIKDATNRIAASRPSGEQVSARSKSPSVAVGSQAAGSGKRPIRSLPPRPPKLGEKALPDDKDPEKERTLESLRLRLPQIIVGFAREKLGTLDTPARMAETEALLGTLRSYATLEFGWNRSKQLPDPITVSRLYELTRPDFRKGNWMRASWASGSWRFWLL